MAGDSPVAEIFPQPTHERCVRSISVFVSLNYPGSVNLSADGASRDEGVVHQLGRKVAWSKKVPLAVTTRGNVGMSQKVKEMVV